MVVQDDIAKGKSDTNNWIKGTGEPSIESSINKKDEITEAAKNYNINEMLEKDRKLELSKKYFIEGVLGAVNTVRSYCLSQEKCEGCIFNHPSPGCMLYNIPEEWYLGFLDSEEQ